MTTTSGRGATSSREVREIEPAQRAGQVVVAAMVDAADAARHRWQSRSRGSGPGCAARRRRRTRRACRRRSCRSRRSWCRRPPESWASASIARRMSRIFSPRLVRPSRSATIAACLQVTLGSSESGAKPVVAQLGRPAVAPLAEAADLDRQRRIAAPDRLERKVPVAASSPCGRATSACRSYGPAGRA